MARLESNEIRIRIHERIRKKVHGTQARPRLCVFRSNKHIYAQIVDDSQGSTLASACSRDAETKGGIKNGGNIAAAKAVGKMVAQRAIGKGISDVLFDRGGYIYHGRVKALADAAREAGLKF
jgi:large subunit ribosomal protein L18